MIHLIELSHPAILSAMSGTTDGIFCRRYAEMGCGAVTLGGISADKETMMASRILVEKGRKEFLFDDLGEWLGKNIGEARKGGKPILVNVRSSTVSGYLKAGKIIEGEGAWLEVNAHCRQEDMMKVGAGQSLLGNPKRLEKILDSLKKKVSCPVILKFRGNVADERSIVGIAEKYCDGIHVDAYQEGKEKPDLSVLQKIFSSTLFKIANNYITDAVIAEGTYPFCDAFSFGRLSLNPKNAKQLLAKTSYYLFAYGTLTNKDKAKNLLGHEVEMKDAILQNFRKKGLGGIYFAFPKREEKTEGKLLRLRLQDFGKLDKYEGVEFGMYERTCADVVVEDKKIRAHVYAAGKRMRG